jgi:hypothetical protein
MNTQETIENIFKVTGEVNIKLYDSHGNLKDERTTHNLVVSAGKIYIAGRMQGTSVPTVMGNMAIGTSTATPAVGQTQLTTEAGRVALASFTNGGTAAVTATATFPAGTGTGAITEAGIFNAGSAGTMLCRTTFPVVNKAAGDSIAITWIITVS